MMAITIVGSENGTSTHNPSQAVFGNGLDWKKWIDTVTDLIDMRKKVRMFCIEK
jgi:hypothetical protein